MKLQNKTMLVTGGGSGMGRELVLQLLARECNVIAIDINADALQETARLACNDKDLLTTYVVDITNRDAVNELADRMQQTSNIDGIINNAGIIQPFLKLNDTSFDVVKRVFNINFFGTLNVIKAFLPHLLTRPEAHVVNVSSMGGFMPVAGQGIYGASKAAIKIMSESLGSELTDTNVRVTIVFPGALRTNIKINSGLGKEAGRNPDDAPEGLALLPSKAAEIIIRGIEKNKAQVYVGNDAKSMNALYRLKPSLAVKFIYKKIKHKM